MTELVCGNGGHCDRCGYCIENEAREENKCVGEDGRVYGASSTDCPAGEVSQHRTVHVDSGCRTRLLLSRPSRLQRILQRHVCGSLRHHLLHLCLLRAAGSVLSFPLMQNVDCMGICNGEAFLDDCGVCSGGTSGWFSSPSSRRAQSQLRQGLRRRVFRNERFRLQCAHECDGVRRHAPSRRHTRHLQHVHVAHSLQHGYCWAFSRI